MNFFKAIAVIRLLCIPFYFLLDKLWMDSIPDTGPFSGLEIDIDYTSWEMLAGYVVIIVIPVNTIIQLLISFKPRAFISGFLKNRIFLRVFYTIELLLLPFLVYTAYQSVQENFFPPQVQNSLIGVILSEVFPPDQNTRSIYEKLIAVDFCILSFCSLVFITLFWKVHKARISTSI